MIVEAPRSSWPVMANRRSSTASDSAPPVQALARAQGSQFTSTAFTGLLTGNAIAISMDGRGAWRDNVFVERLWRSVKYEEIYLRAYDTVAEASLARYFGFYNSRRPHSSLDRQTPDQAYFTPLPQIAAA